MAKCDRETKTVKIGPIVYEIEKVVDLCDGDDSTDLWGDARTDECKIYIEKNSF